MGGAYFIMFRLSDEDRLILLPAEMEMSRPSGAWLSFEARRPDTFGTLPLFGATYARIEDEGADESGLEHQPTRDEYDLECGCEVMRMELVVSAHGEPALSGLGNGPI